MVVENNIEIIYNLIEKTYLMDPLAFEKSYKNPDIITDKSNLIKILDSIISLFPRIHTRYVNKISSVINMFYKLSLLGKEMQNYLNSKQAIFIFITYFLGKDSPCYDETKVKNNELWGYHRGYIAGGESMTNMIYTLFKSAVESEVINKYI